MNTRMMEVTDADTLARRIREGSLTNGGADNDLQWDRKALQAHLRLCAVGAGAGILGAAAIGLWFRFGHTLERPIELALSAISIGFLVLFGTAAFNAIGPLLFVFARERLGRVFMEEELATAEANERTWRDIAYSSALLASHIASPVRTHDEAVAALVRGTMDSGGLTSPGVSPGMTEPGPAGLRKRATPPFDIELLLLRCRGTPGSPFQDLTVTAFETNPRRAIREMRERLETLEREISATELLEVDAKLKYAIVVLDASQDEPAR